MVQEKILDWFSNLSKESVAIAGGKGASLGEMTKAGIPVPNGFVILSSSFEKFLEETDLNVEIDSILEKVNHKEMNSIENSSEEIKALIMNAKMPIDIEKEISSNFKVLNSPFVAVRSSATSEDSSSAAWAGQLDSFLNTKKDTLLENVKRCWASLFTPRAIFYRFEKGLHNTKISVAVVVQKMVNSEISGIAFSVHPVTQDRNQLIIEAGLGLGEAIVSGQITPDSYVVEKNPRRIIDKNISEQERGLFKVESGGSEWKENLPRGKEQKLTDKQIMELSEIILTIEKHYGFPCDIEWAFEDKKFFIVQSRPITTLTDKSNDKEMPSVENEILKDKIVDERNNIFLKHGVVDLKKYKLAKIVRRNNSPFFNSLMRVGSTLKNPELDFDSRMLVHVILDRDIYYCEDDLSKLENILLKKAENDSTFFKNYFNKVIDDCTKFINWSKKIKDFSNPLMVFDEFTNNSLKIMSHLWPCAAPEKWILNQIELEIAKHINPKKDFDEFRKIIVLLTAPTEFSETNLKKKEIFEGKNLKKVYEKYVWATDQSFSLNYESFDEFKKAQPIVKNPKAELKKMKNDLNELKESQNKIIKKFKLKKEFVTLCKCAQMLPHIRLIRRDCIIQAGYNLRSFFKELNKKLPLSDLTLGYYWEIRDLIEEKEVDISLIEKRKDTYSFVVIDNEFYDYDKETAAKLKEGVESSLNLGSEVVGQIACMGKVKGKARVLFSSKEINLVQKGDILVTSMTTPDFVPAMEKAIAFVTDEGGLSCHAAIIAREMQKPCVIGTKNATKIIKDGDYIEVDANKGIVKILDNKISKSTMSTEVNTNNSTNKIYKKLFSRDLSVMRMQFLSIGEEDGIKSLTNNKFFFKPLFVKNDSENFDIYYNFSSPSQNSTNLVLELKNNLPFVIERLKEAKVHCSTLKSIISSNNCSSAEKVFELVKIIQPFSSIGHLVGDLPNVPKEVFDVFAKYRVDYDGLIYEAEEFLLKCAKKKGLKNSKLLIFEEIFKGKKVSDLKNREKGFAFFENRIIPINKLNSFLVEQDIDLGGFNLTWAKGFLQNNPLDIKEARFNLPVGEIIFATYAQSNRFGDDISPVFIPHVNQKGQQIFSENKMKSLERNVWENALKDKKKFVKILKEATKIQKKIDLLSVSPKELKKLNSKALHTYFKKLVKLSKDWWVYGSIAEDKGLVVEEKLVPLLMKNHNVSGEFAFEYVSDMSAPLELSIFSKERMTFLDLCIKAKTNSKLIKNDKKYFKELEKYSKDFFYSRTSFYEVVSLEKENLIKLIEENCGKNSLESMKDEYKKISSGVANLREKQKLYKKKLTLTKEESDYLWYFTQMHIWMDERKASMMKHFNYLMNLMQEVSNRNNIPYDTISMLTLDELENLILGKEIDLVKISKRKEGVFFIYKKDEILRFFDDNAQELIKSIPSRIDSKDIIKGAIACKGNGEKIQGKVRIVHNPSKDVFNEGEILVTTMTRPEFVPIMKSALAIITDEGGLTSHAAIVSRELAIPCIIGTKNATRLLHDGDEVEIDANTGIIKIIKQELNSNNNEVNNGVNFLFVPEKGYSQKFPGFPLYTSYGAESFDAMEKHLGYSFNRLRLMYQDGQMEIFYFEKEVKCVFDIVNEKYAKDKNYFKKIRSLHKKQCEVLEKKIKAKEKKDISSLNESELNEYLLISHEFLLNSVGIAHIIESITLTQTHVLKDKLAEFIKDPKNLIPALNILTTPIESSFIQKYVSLVKKFHLEKNKKTKSKLLNNIIKNYNWISNSTFGKVVLTSDSINALADSKFTENSTSNKKLILEKKLLIKKYSLPSEVIQIADFLSFVTIWQDERKAIMLKGFGALGGAIEELSLRTKISAKDLAFLTFDEIINKKYQDKSILKEIEQRKLFSVFFYNYSQDPKYKIFSGENTKKLFLQQEAKQEENNVATIGGMGVSTGKAIGRVMICRTMDDIKNFKANYVLVVSMTRPEFLPAMKKAVAIVTDEGGITCHAAILSRELGIPCIIGTKNATKLLHNEDLVEVKANHGQVMVLEKFEK